MFFGFFCMWKLHNGPVLTSAFQVCCLVEWEKGRASSRCFLKRYLQCPLRVSAEVAHGLLPLALPLLLRRGRKMGEDRCLPAPREGLGAVPGPASTSPLGQTAAACQQWEVAASGRNVPLPASCGQAPRLTPSWAVYFCLSFFSRPGGGVSVRAPAQQRPRLLPSRRAAGRVAERRDGTGRARMPRLLAGRCELLGCSCSAGTKDAQG